MSGFRRKVDENCALLGAAPFINVSAACSQRTLIRSHSNPIYTFAPHLAKNNFNVADNRLLGDRFGVDSYAVNVFVLFGDLAVTICRAIQEVCRRIRIYESTRRIIQQELTLRQDRYKNLKSRFSTLPRILRY
jgi:hypothetical protein